MKSTALKTLLFTLALTLSFSTLAQNQPGGDNFSYFDIGIKTGSFLPSKIRGVTELLPIFGVKVGHSVSQSIGFEYDFDAANAKGITYYNAYFSLRFNFAVENVLPLFFLLGVDAHKYRTADTYISITQTRIEGVSSSATGWHAGFGSETLVYGDLWFRGDIRMGFGPGRQLTVSFAGIYRF